jgi:hypothetical protein
MRRSILLLGTVVISIPAAVRAQAPGLVPRVTVYTSYAEHSDGSREPGGTRRIILARATIGGVPAWTVVNQLKVGDVSALDSVAMADGDFHPLFRHTVTSDGEHLTLDLRDSVVIGRMKSPDGSVSLSLRPGERAFMNYYALRAALQAWPLAAGWRTTASVLELNGLNRFVPLDVAVEGEEQVQVPAGDFDCWIVHVTASQGIDERYWVSKAGQFVVRTREPLARGLMLGLELSSVSPPP